MNSDSESLQTDLLDWLLAYKTNIHKPKLLDCKELEGVYEPLKEVATFTGGEP
ncbi:hypothetical protein VB620_19360 [Nodularia harveyana UHCC-0300]|uniref:Uncharacterized protein n=1 Tax=Nodularia harveyana UHCC-0300 TaxID=2974287 RepID=A0ABU5UJ05_9CYAN|nr:hypothetical protein [Nodularia harveyana]MEA5583490.1 hypothetical protein [Nodularia harveyana UHCC-0300]